MKRSTQRETGWRKGSITVLVVLCIPVLMGFVAATVDVGYFYLQKSNAQAVADMACLTSLGNVNFAELTADEEKEAIRGQMAKIIAVHLGDAGALGDLSSDDVVSFELDDLDPPNVNAVRLRGKAHVPTFFMKLGAGTVGSSTDEIEIAVSSKAAVRYVQSSGRQNYNLNDFGLVGKDDVTFKGAATAGSYSSDADHDGTSPIPPITGTGDAAEPTYTELYQLKIGSGGDVLVSNGNPGKKINGDTFAAGNATMGSKAGNYNDPEVGLRRALGHPGEVRLADPSFLPDPLPPLPGEINNNLAILNGVTGGLTTPSFNGAASPEDQIASIKNTADQLMPGDALTVRPGGVYVLDGFNFSTPSDLSISGAPVDATDPGKITTIYTTGKIHISGRFAYNGSKLRIIGLGDDPTVDNSGIDAHFTGLAQFYADLYAPKWSLKFTGNSQFFGRAAVKEITGTGNSDIYHDVTLSDEGIIVSKPSFPRVDQMCHLVDETE